MLRKATLVAGRALAEEALWWTNTGIARHGGFPGERTFSLTVCDAFLTVYKENSTAGVLWVLDRKVALNQSFLSQNVVL